MSSTRLVVLAVTLTALAASGPALARSPEGTAPPTELPARPVPPTAPPAVAPPPAAPLPPDPNPAAAPPSRTFASRGVLEIGGSLGLGFDYFVNGEDSYLGLDLSFYLGWFVTRHLVLGTYLSLPYSQYWSSTSEDSDYWQVSPGIVLAPGFATGLGSGRIFFFGDLLLGIHGVKQGGNLSQSGYLGQLGVELGIKVVVGTNYLVRVGLRPTYYLGKMKAEGSTFEADKKQFNLMLRLGFSGFI